MGANGQNFILGSLNNAATKVTGLVGNVDGAAALRVTNNNADANDTALDLRVQDNEAPMRVNSGVKVTSLNADTVDGKDFSDFGAQEVISHIRGPLPREATFTSKGGTLIITTAGSGFRGSSLREGLIGVEVRLDGLSVGTTRVYTNERDSHKAFAPFFAVKQYVPAGPHAIRLQAWRSSGCNTADERTFTLVCTDLNDYFRVMVTEIPD